LLGRRSAINVVRTDWHATAASWLTRSHNQSLPAAPEDDDSASPDKPSVDFFDRLTFLWRRM
jgi:hypothetical protein